MEVSSLGGRGKIIIEHPGLKESDLCEYYREIWLNGSNYPTFSMKFTNLAETIYYSHDFSCEGLQLADFIVGSIGHAVENKTYDFICEIKNHIAQKDGKVKGVGIIVYPSNSIIADDLIRHCLKKK